MTRLERWLLKRIFALLIIQGPEHRSNLVEVYRLAIRATMEEFTEDNHPTLECFNKECFEEALSELKG